MFLPVFPLFVIFVCFCADSVRYFAAYSEGKPQAASLRSNRVFQTRSAVRQGVLTTAVCDVPIAGSVMLSRPVSR